MNLLLASRKTTGFGTPLVGFNYDSNKSTGIRPITSSHTTAQLIVDTVPVQGYTKVLQMNGTVINLRPLSAFELTTADFTMEIRYRCTNTAGTYATNFYILSSNNLEVQNRFGDSGLGYRLLYDVMPSGAGINGVYSSAPTQSSMSTAYHHVVMQRASGLWTFWVDGVRQQTAIWTSSNYSYQTINVQDSITNCSQASLGWPGYPQYSTGTNIAEWVVFNGAKYTTNFTPPVGYLVK